ncbi:MAG TPA: zf-HC2 domain-containing protein [Marinobacterium sp.]|nr:zf-HC2 domain-containing protein [Marinobacterium sp.]
MSCLRATERMSQSLDQKLPLTERVQLKLHLLMCKRCERCQQQMELLHRVCRKRSDQSADN